MDSMIRKLERLGLSGDNEAQCKLVEWRYRLGELSISSGTSKVIPRHESGIYLAVTRLSFLWEARVCSCCSQALNTFHVWSYQLELHFCNLECYDEYRDIYELYSGHPPLAYTG